MNPQQTTLVATASQTVGPFFHFGLGVNPALGSLIVPDLAGERLDLHLRVFDRDGLVVPDALIEIWQADAAGVYAPPPGDETTPSGFRGFGRLCTSAEGDVVFETIRPGPVVDTAGATHASHINVCVFARGLLRQLHTRVYFEQDPALAIDPVLALVPTHRRATLIATRSAEQSTRWALDIRLRGDKETVFFDL